MKYIQSIHKNYVCLHKIYISYYLYMLIFASVYKYLVPKVINRLIFNVKELYCSFDKIYMYKIYKSSPVLRE